MVGYDEAIYREVLEKAIDNIDEIKAAVDGICEKGYKNLYLVDLVVLIPWQVLLPTFSRRILLSPGTGRSPRSS